MPNSITGHYLTEYDNYVGVVKPSPEAWEWYAKNRDGDVHIFEETTLPDHVNYPDKIKVALLGEVPDIYAHAKRCNPTQFNPYEYLEANHQHFDFTFSPYTYLKGIVGESKYRWAVVQNSFIAKEQYGMYEKERLLSIVASHKNWLPGHQMRHEVITRYKDKMDVYGSGYNSVINDYDIMGKVIAIAPYYFTVIIPNTKIDDWFSDQMTDAMCVGTIPVFCGCRNVANYFNANGIIQFDAVEELGKILPTLTKELYLSKMDAVRQNYEKAIVGFMSPADWLYAMEREFLENFRKT